MTGRIDLGHVGSGCIDISHRGRVTLITGDRGKRSRCGQMGSMGADLQIGGEGVAVGILHGGAGDNVAATQGRHTVAGGAVAISGATRPGRRGAAVTVGGGAGTGDVVAAVGTVAAVAGQNRNFLGLVDVLGIAGNRCAIARCGHMAVITGHGELLTGVGGISADVHQVRPAHAFCECSGSAVVAIGAARCAAPREGTVRCGHTVGVAVSIGALRPRPRATGPGIEIDVLRCIGVLVTGCNGIVNGDVRGSRGVVAAVAVDIGIGTVGIDVLGMQGRPGRAAIAGLTVTVSATEGVGPVPGRSRDDSRTGGHTILGVANAGAGPANRVVKAFGVGRRGTGSRRVGRHLRTTDLRILQDRSGPVRRASGVGPGRMAVLTAKDIGGRRVGIGVGHGRRCCSTLVVFHVAVGQRHRQVAVVAGAVAAGTGRCAAPCD